MSYQLTVGLALSPLYTGITDWSAQLVDTIGVNTGSAVTTGFVALGGGQYQWTGTIPPAFRGSVVFSSASADVTLSAAINSIDGAGGGADDGTGILGGITRLADWLAALAGKAADPATLAEM